MIPRLAACKPQDLTGCPLPPWLISFPSPQVDDTAGVCWQCGCAVWVGPRTLVLIRAGQATAACYQCAMAIMEEHPGMTLEILRGRPDRPRGDAP